jgi:precorrin-2 dehydrogenase / sirohydrochlorin ferrochelatase
MGYYPFFLEMNRRRCVVIGGGTVAERRIEGLLGAGASVAVISPKINEGLGNLRAEKRIRHIERAYETGDLTGYDLVFVATDEPEVNARVCRDARARGVWINSADDPAHCDFILPAVIRRGDLTVAVSTGGASPAATRAIREELDQYFTGDYAGFVRIAEEVRNELRGRSLTVSADGWNRALKGDFRRLLQQGRPEQAKTLLLERLGAGAKP